MEVGCHLGGVPTSLSPARLATVIGPKVGRPGESIIPRSQVDVVQILSPRGPALG